MRGIEGATATDRSRRCPSSGGAAPAALYCVQQYLLKS